MGEYTKENQEKKLLDKIEIFCKYQENFFPKEATGKKATEYINGYITAIKDILNLIDYERKCY